MSLNDLRVADDTRWGRIASADVKAQGLVWRHRRKNGAEMDMEVIWSPVWPFAENSRRSLTGHRRDGAAPRDPAQLGVWPVEPQFERGHHGVRSRHVYLRGCRLVV